MNKMLRMCLNWKVLGGLALVAAGVWAYRPDLLGSALPLLLLAVCPLSMLWMMKSMNHGEKAGSTPETANLPNDPDLLRARMSVLAAEQEQVAEHLAQLPRPASSTDGGSETSSRNGSA